MYSIHLARIHHQTARWVKSPPNMVLISSWNFLPGTISFLLWTEIIIILTLSSTLDYISMFTTMPLSLLYVEFLTPGLMDLSFHKLPPIFGEVIFQVLPEECI